MGDALRLVSVVIPAHNEAAGIAALVRAVYDQGKQTAGAEVEVIVVDDGSNDGTIDAAREAGAKVVQMGQGKGGNPAAARNCGAAVSHGDPIIFLDADCTPTVRWLEAILGAHDRGATVVGGALDLPPGLSASARCDYYCSCYLIHSRRPAGYVPHHPPANLSVKRDGFFRTSGFTEQPWISSHRSRVQDISSVEDQRSGIVHNEEREWQAELQREGNGIYFEPRAAVYHHNRPSFIGLLRRNYRWGYTAIEVKARTQASRMSWLYQYPRLLIVGNVPLAFAHTAYILGCWLRVGVLEPLLMSPVILASRFAYTAGMSVGGIRWLRRRGTPTSKQTPRWV